MTGSGLEGSGAARLRSVDEAEALVARARELARGFAARANETEAARRIPAELSREMARAGFYRLFVPRALGGIDASPETGVRVFEALAQGDASCAWVAFIGATAATMLVQIPEAAAREVFASSETLITGVFAPTGRAEQADGGFRVSGRWQWGSGCENAQWIAGGCTLMRDGAPIPGPGGAPRQHLVLFPAREVEILDTWHVSGMCGTGSTDYQVRDLLVPASHVAGWIERAPSDRPLEHFPYFTFLALSIAAVSLGIARASIDELISLAATKRRAGSTSVLAARPHTQLEVAQAEARLRSARAFYFEALASAWERACAGGEIPVEARRDLRLATTHAVLESAKVVDAMYGLGGGTSVYETSALQRHFRDVHVATQHIMVGTGTLETAGRLLLGLETNTSML